jgi:hypothetical protein
MKEFTIQGSGRKVRINENDFKSQKSGGQATVYLQGSTAYKVYSDASQMIPTGKIQELAALSIPEIIRPRDILLDKAANAVGYTMDAVDDAYVLCQLFPRSFRLRTGLTNEKVIELVQKLRALTQHCHDNGVLVVDLNEMNYLVDKAFDRVYQIDIDSAQTRSFPANALMESVRDRHAVPGVFNHGTDWFAFAIVTFQMFVGIHPYKGVHPKLGTLDDRMIRNVSVFHEDVDLPAAVLPFDVIPALYRDWYRAVFDAGKRIPPPLAMSGPIVIAPTVVRAAAAPGASAFVFDTLLAFDGDVVNHIGQVTVTTRGVFLGTQKVADLGPDTLIAITPRHLRPVAAWCEGGVVRFRDLKATVELAQSFAAEQMMVTDGRLYIKQASAINEVGFVETVNAVVPGIRQVAHVMPHATQLYEGVAVQHVFGTIYASLFPKAGVHYSVRLPELEGCTIVDAKCERGVMMVVVECAGRYDKAILRFDDRYTTYDIRWTRDIATYSVNFVTLDSGVVVHINENDEVEIFSADMGSSSVKVIIDPAVGNDCLLFKNGAQALIARGGTLSKFSMRP